MALDVPKSPESIDMIKDRVFEQYMKVKIMDEFYSDLKDYFDDKEIERFREAFSALSDDELTTVISIPFELKKRLFETLFNLYNAGKSLDDVIHGYLSQLSRYEFGIGYHTSPHDIKPTESGQWNIKGTEADHRDGDRMMAYYSTQYRHLFKKRHPKYIYAVRSSLADDSHKTDGNWHRGDTLSVIMKIPFEEVVNYVESTTKKVEEAR